MAQHTVTLKTGLTIGEAVHKEVVLRELTAGDIIDAQAESERLVQTPEGPALVASPSQVGIHTLRRQIARIGSVEGPLSLRELKRLDPEDLYLLQQEADRLDAAASAETASREVTQRGRDDAPRAGDRARDGDRGDPDRVERE